MTAVEKGTLQVTSPRTADSNHDDTSKDVPGPYWHGTPASVRMLNVYHFVYKQYGFDFRPSHRDLLWFEWLGATNRLEDYLKWRTANILARAVGSLDRVPCPFPYDRIPAIFNYYLDEQKLGLLSTDNGFYRMKLHTKKRRFIRFCFSLYQSKAASLPAPDWKIQVATDDTVRRILSDKKITGSLMTPSQVLGVNDVLAELDRTVDEVFPQLPEFSAPIRHPGRGACIGAPRSAGGAFGYTVKWCLRYDFCPYEFLCGFFVGPSGVQALYSSICPEDWTWARSQSRLRAMNARGCPCIPVSFAEPFKVRTVTLGEQGVYSVARDYQPRVWRYLQRHPTFQLVGKTLDAEALRHFSSNWSREDDPYLISGDYKQATDHIPSFLSERVLERTLLRLGVPFEHVSVLLVALTGHVVPAREDLTSLHWTDVGYGCQRGGQLMGSPISFPILCLINAALSRLSYETAHENRIRVDLSELPMLINGDDLLMTGSMSTYLNWKRVVGWAGLLPSQGKTLVSTEYGTINSRMIRFYDKRTFGTRWNMPVLQPHLQLQLALGSMKSGQYDFNSRLIGSGNPRAESLMWDQFLSSCPDPKRGWRFLWGVNSRYLMTLTRRFPRSAICLPTDAGGLGFPLPPSDSPFSVIRRPRDSNLLFARLLLDEATEEHHTLRSRWFNALQDPADRSSESLIMEWQSQWERRTGCPSRHTRIEESPDVLQPPVSLLGRVASVNRRVDEVDINQKRHRLYLDALRACKAYSRSGRGPWSLDEVSRFLRAFRWSTLYGRYTTP